MARLDGKTALVTGAAGGLGAAICERLAAEGAWVAVADVDEDKGVRLARKLGKASVFCPLDVTRPEAWAAAIETVTTQFGGLDILVNNAGILKPADIETATVEDWESAMAVSGRGTFLGCKAGIAAMKTRAADQGWASIINMASTMAIRGVERHPAYCAAKAAVRQLTKSVARHCGVSGYRIRVNCVLPGAIETDMLRLNIPPGGSEADYFAQVRAYHPIGRLGTPRDIADGVVFLASAESAFMTGSDLVIDGGSTA